MATIKLIHSADWQLGKPFGRMPPDVRSALAEARLDAIDRLAEAAVGCGAAHIVVAGDVFDNVEPGDRVVQQALGRMARATAQWWLMPGNHDHARADGLWSRIRAQAPLNVHVVDTPEPVALADDAWLLPAPLEHRRTIADPTAAMVDMATPPEALRIGLAHGAIKEFGSSGESTNIIPPDRAGLAALDYLALGDWHGFLKVGDRTAYSGTPETDRFKHEDKGGCLALTIRSGDVPVIERIETGRYRWLFRQWPVTGSADLEAEMERLEAGGRLDETLLSVRLDGITGLADRVAIMEAIEGRFAHRLRYLDLDIDNLVVRPTAEDVALIDVQGALAGAAALLRAGAEGSGPDAALSASALERLYVEALRFDGGSAQ